MLAATASLTTLAVGHVTHDRRGPGFVAGGSAWYAARVWRALGHRARLVSVVGADFAQDAALAGLETSLARAGRTTVFDNVYAPGAPRRQYVAAQAAPVGPDLLPADWSRPDVLFLAPVLGEVDVPAWAAVRARVTGVGLQGWLKRAGEETPQGRQVGQRPADVDPRQFAGADAAFLSVEDLAGDEAWLDGLAAHVPLVFLTRGAEGCDVVSAQKRWQIGTFRTGEVDATGAGDTFAAATLCALAAGASVSEAARFGAAAASIIVEGVGADTAPRLLEAHARYPAIS